MLASEHESGKTAPILPNREIEENKWSAQRYGLAGAFIDHATHEAVETRSAIRSLAARLSQTTDRDLSGLRSIVEDPTESVRQLEVWRETGSTLEVARDLAHRTRTSVDDAMD
jgi:carboxylate-amine ligase